MNMSRYSVATSSCEINSSIEQYVELQHLIYTYFKARYYELYVFRYLQDISNRWTEGTMEEKKTYLQCLMFILCRLGGLTARASFVQTVIVGHRDCSKS